MGQLNIVEDQWVPRRMLPQRIPHCTWADIDRYLDEGCDLISPAEGETMTQQEMEMISELLTNQQMRLMIVSGEMEIEQMRASTTSVLEVADAMPPVAEPTSGNGRKDEALKLREDGLTGAEIAERVNAPVVLVHRWLNEGE